MMELGGWQRHWPPTPLSQLWTSAATRWGMKELGGWQMHWPPIKLSQLCTSMGATGAKRLAEALATNSSLTRVGFNWGWNTRRLDQAARDLPSAFWEVCARRSRLAPPSLHG